MRIPISLPAAALLALSMLVSGGCLAANSTNGGADEWQPPEQSLAQSQRQSREYAEDRTDAQARKEWAYNDPHMRKDRRRRPPMELGDGMDRESFRHVTLPVQGREMAITPAVPPASQSGKAGPVRPARTERVRDGQITIPLSSTPVYIEEVRSSQAQARHGKPGKGGFVGQDKRNPFAVSIAGMGREPKVAVDHMIDAGAGWIRFMSHMGGLLWDKIEPEPGRYDWSAPDAMYRAASHRGLRIMANIYAMNPRDQKGIALSSNERTGTKRLPARYPSDIKAYTDFVRKAVERYDGDGHRDAPGSPRVDAWIVGSEMESHHRWQDTPENYAKLFLATWKEIKRSDPTAMVVMYGSNYEMNRKQGRLQAFTIPVVRELERLARGMKHFDWVYSLHHYKAPAAGLAKVIDEARGYLDTHGFRRTPIWITDAATFFAPMGPEYRSERTLAADVVRFHATALAHGVQRFVWAQIADAKRGRAIESGLLGMDPSRRTRDLQRKAAFQAYQTMTRELRLVDIPATRIVWEGRDDVYLYRFRRHDGTFVYVAWIEEPDDSDSDGHSDGDHRPMRPGRPLYPEPEDTQEPDRTVI